MSAEHLTTNAGDLVGALVYEDGSFVAHHVEIDLSPNRTGSDRKRSFKITGDLVLRAAPPLPERVEALTIT